MRRQFPEISCGHLVTSWVGIALTALTGSAALATLAARHLMPNAPDLPSPNNYCSQELNLYRTLLSSMNVDRMIYKPGLFGNQSGFRNYWGECLIIEDNDYGPDDTSRDYLRNFRGTTTRRHFPEGTLGTVTDCGAELLRFVSWYPQTVASHLVKAYADIWPKCIEILKTNELRPKLDKASLMLGGVAGITLTATGYSIYRMAKEWRYRSALNSAIKGLNETAT